MSAPTREECLAKLAEFMIDKAEESHWAAPIDEAGL